MKNNMFRWLVSVALGVGLAVGGVAAAEELPAVPGPAHPDYTNVLAPDRTVYRIESGRRHPYTSAGAFLSYGFNSWAQVETATAGDMAYPLSTYSPSGSTEVVTSFIPPRNGSLINDKGTIYLITNGTRIGFTENQVFLDLGYSYRNVQPGDTSFMVSMAPINNSDTPHPDGTLVKAGKTIYLIKNNTRQGVPSMQVFISWGMKLEEVVLANQHDLAMPVSGTMTGRMSNQLNY